MYTILMTTRFFVVTTLIAVAYSYCNVRVPIKTKIRMSGAHGKMLGSLMIASSFTSYPFGNIGAAIQAVLQDAESLTCNLDNQNIRDNQSSCQQLDKLVRLRAGKLLTIKQDWGGSSSTGAAVWNGANMAGWYMENTLGKDRIEGSRVLELGAGVGFASLIASNLGAQEVVITDGNEDVLKLADENILINVPKEKQLSIRTARLRWNTDDELQFLNRNNPFDYIFAADVTYLEKNRPDLISSIVHLSGPNTITFLSLEPRNVGEVEDILAEATKQGLTWKEERLPVDPVAEQCTLSCARMFALQKAQP